MYCNAYNERMKKSEIIAYYGTQKKAASAIGIEQPSVAGWKEDSVPHLRQLQYEMQTGGKLVADPAAKPAQVSA